MGGKLEKYGAQISVLAPGNSQHLNPSLCMSSIKLILFTINTKLCQHHLISNGR